MAKGEIEISFHDGEPVSVNVIGPYKMGEQAAFEEQFGVSFVVVERGWSALAMAAKAAFDGDRNATVPAESFLHVRWLMFIAWRRLRGTGKVPGKFSTFLDTVDNYEWTQADESDIEELEQALSDDTEGDEGEAPDPTSPVAVSAPDQ